MRSVVVMLLALSALSAGQGKQTFRGTIFDDTCAKLGHSAMRMGPTDADCARACVLYHGDAYVLADGKNVYHLSDQTGLEKFAAAKVTVVGTLDEKTRTIQVDSVAAAD